MVDVRVSVIGGGVIGLASAWRLAQRGLDVTVFDPAPGSGASHVAAGMLAPVTEVTFGEEEVLQLNLESARRYPSFVAELEAATGRPTGYHPFGTLVVARDNDDLAALERLAAFQRELGLEVTKLRAGICRELEPGLAPGVRGGLLVAGDHQVDPRALVVALMAGCEQLGVRFVAERRSDAATDDADVVVVAAGCWSGDIAGVDLPIRPVKGQLLRLRGKAGVERNIRGVEVYIVPRPEGEVVVGATAEERGFDTTVTAGAVHELLRAAVELVPDVAELELVEASAGLRPTTPDNRPIIERRGDVVVATGHYRNGVLLAPLTADLVVELVLA
jgi:glycine oxidase